MTRKLALLMTILLSTLRLVAAEEVLKNEDIVRLVEAGLSAATIEEKIRLSSTDFDLATDGLVALKRSQVPESVIRAMLARQGKKTTGGETTPPATHPVQPHSPAVPPSATVPRTEPTPAPSPQAVGTQPAKRKKLFEANIHKTRHARCPGEVQVDTNGVTGRRCKDLDFKVTWKEIRSICYVYEFVGRMKIVTKPRTYEISTTTPVQMKDIRGHVRGLAPAIKETECE